MRMPWFIRWKNSEFQNAYKMGAKIVLLYDFLYLLNKLVMVQAKVRIEFRWHFPFKQDWRPFSWLSYHSHKVSKNLEPLFRKYRVQCTNHYLLIKSRWTNQCENWCRKSYENWWQPDAKIVRNVIGRIIYLDFSKLNSGFLKALNVLKLNFNEVERMSSKMKEIKKRRKSAT